MFERPPESYKVSKNSIQGILKDVANPLTQIVQEVEAGSVVLDAGAGNGILPMLFRATNKSIVIDGVEPSEAATKIARPHYRNFYKGYLQDFYPEIKTNNYDYVILADVIEHVINPEEFLRDILTKIGRNTKIILSTPNIAFATIRLDLLDGRFNYVNSGLLEKTHLRFFTKSTLEGMLKNLDVGVNRAKFLQRRFDRTEIPFRKKRHFLLLPWLLMDDMASTYQFFLVLSKSSADRSLDKAERVGETLTMRNFLLGG